MRSSLPGLKQIQGLLRAFEIHQSEWCEIGRCVMPECAAAELQAKTADLLRRTRKTRQDAEDARRSVSDTLQAARNLRQRAAAARAQAQDRGRRRSQTKKK